MLPSLTLTFISGLVLGSFIPYFTLSVSIVLCIAAIGSAMLEARYPVKAGRVTAGFCCMLIGIVYWSLAVEGPSKPSFREQDFEGVQELHGRIIAPVQLAPDRMVMIVRLDQTLERPDQPFVIRLTWRTPERFLFQGDRIAVRAKLRAPSGSLNPGGFDYAAYLERQGIDATATVSGVDAVTFLESGQQDIRWRVWNRFDRWRGSIRLAAIQSLSQPALGLYLGIIIGERGYLDPELRDPFMVTGTVHLLSISGSHLGLVAFLMFILVKRTLVMLLPAAWLLALSRRITPTRLAAVTTVVPVTAYACLAGAELATVRSLMMVLVALIAKWFGHEQHMFHALSVAAVAMLLHDPQAIYDISFQLSFVSVGAIAWWLSWPAHTEDEGAAVAPSWCSRLMRWAGDAAVMSAVVTLTTVPFVAFYFNQVPWLGVIANVVAVPVMGGLLVPMGLAPALWQSMVETERLPFDGVIEWSLDWFVLALDKASSLPGGEWHVASPSVPSILLFYGCLAGIWFGSDRRRIRWIASAGLLLLVSWWIWSPRLLLDGDRFRVTFLDVSQGDSAVIELPDGEVVLIDGGATYERFDMGRGVVAPYLWNRGIRTIDHVVATHPQLDHIGGLSYILRHFEVTHFWGTGDTREEPFYQRLQQAVALQGLTEQMARDHHEMFASGDCRLHILNPPEVLDAQELSLGRRREGHALNNRSIVIELMCGDHRMLFAADVEREALWRMSQNSRPERIDVLKVPHHGAGSSLQPDWLEHVNPRHAVISVGRHNSYGHPAQNVLDAYVNRGISIYRTDQDGGIWVTGRRSHPDLKIHRTSEEKLQRLALSSCFWICERSNWAKLLTRFDE
jgi:competence protein ComEC